MQRRPFLQSTMLSVGTDQGLTGIGEGGTKETVEQCGAVLIGANR